MTTVYLDAIGIGGAIRIGYESHPHSQQDSLIQVLERLQKAGLRLSVQKCLFLEHSCVYLGHKLDTTGIHLTPEKLSAIQGAPRPSSISELRSFFQNDKLLP